MSGFPIGRHALAADVTVRARLLATDAPAGYTGLLTTAAKKAGVACTQPSDMGTVGDGGITDMAGDGSAKDM